MSKKAPAAVLFRSLFARVFSDECIDRIFREHKQRQVDGDLLFSSLIRLLTPVISGSLPAVHSSYQEMEEEIGVSHQAVYDKLRGVETPVCEALVRIPGLDLAKVRKQSKTLGRDPIPGYHTFIIDGKRLDATEHRLPETRAMKSAPLPGTVLGLLDMRLEMFVNIVCHPDAYVCERKIVQPLLTSIPKGGLVLVDRNFCDGPLIGDFLRAELYFVVRHHGRSPRWRKIAGCRRIKVGQNARGGTAYEQEIEVLLPGGVWYRVRRITIQLVEPTRDGDTELHLLSNLPSSVSALTIADTYAERWTIETCLEYLAQSLNAEINTLAYPGAALLCFSLALTLYNMMSTLKALLLKFSTASQKPDLSYYYLALEISRTCWAMMNLFDSKYWIQYARMSDAQYVDYCKAIAENANLRRYRKHARGPKRPPPKRISGKRRPHVSTHRILEARKVTA